MKKNSLAALYSAVFALLLSFSASAQYGGCDSFSDISEAFTKTKTLVVLTGNEAFDKNMKEGLEAYWKITPYEFITEKEVASNIPDVTKSFLMPLSLVITENNQSQTYPILAVLIGGGDKISEYSYNSLVAYASIDNFGQEKNVIDAAYRAKHMVRFMHDYILLKQEKKISAVCAALRHSAQSAYNEKTQQLKGKTLLIDEAQLKNISKEDVTKNYPGEFKIVNKNEIEHLIHEHKAGYCYLLPVFTRHKYIYVVNAETGEIIYDDYSTYGLKLKGKDIGAIAKTIQ